MYLYDRLQNKEQNIKTLEETTSNLAIIIKDYLEEKPNLKLENPNENNWQSTIRQEKQSEINHERSSRRKIIKIINLLYENPWKEKKKHYKKAKKEKRL